MREIIIEPLPTFEKGCADAFENIYSNYLSRTDHSYNSWSPEWREEMKKTGRYGRRGNGAEALNYSNFAMTKVTDGTSLFSGLTGTPFTSCAFNVTSIVKPVNMNFIPTPYTTCHELYTHSPQRKMESATSFRFCMEVEMYQNSVFAKEEDVLRYYAYCSSFALIILQFVVAVFVSWGLTTSFSFWCCWCCNRKKIDAMDKFVTPRFNCRANSTCADFVGFMFFYLGRCTSKSFWGPILWFSWPMKKKQLINWYLIQDDPFSILLPLITQDIFNLMIKIYQGRTSSTESITATGTELFGFVKSCVMILLAIVKALMSMIDIVSGKATVCAVITGGSALLLVGDPTETGVGESFGVNNSECKCDCGGDGGEGCEGCEGCGGCDDDCCYCCCDDCCDDCDDCGDECCSCDTD